MHQHTLIRTVVAVAVLTSTLALQHPALAQIDVDSLRQTCMDDNADPQTRIDACHELANAISQGSVGSENGNLIQQQADAQVAAIQAIAKQAAGRARAQAAQRSNSNGNGTGQCLYDGHPVGGGVALPCYYSK